MRMLSTGQPSTLKTYRKLAGLFGPKAVAFIEKKIEESNEDDEVIAEEGQMLMLLADIEFREENENEVAGQADEERTHTL